MKITYSKDKNIQKILAYLFVLADLSLTQFLLAVIVLYPSAEAPLDLLSFQDTSIQVEWHL